VIKDPNDVAQMQSGLNSMFVATIVTGLIIMALAFFFVRTAMRKAAEKKLAGAAQAT
jgi:heme/copper-type cytochrome/quinol oxidase subunit 2